MQKIDYGDINKFLVSIGILLIGLAILTPYLYLKEDFGLYMEYSQIEKLPPPIQELIYSKQDKIIIIQKFILWISLGFLAFGLIFFITGLVRWFKHQSKLDNKFDKEVLKLDLEISSLTPEETEQKTIKEINEIEYDQQLRPKASIITTSNKQNYLNNYMNIENIIIKVFETYNSKYYDVLSQQRLGNKFEIDILIKSKNENLSDSIVEIKYFRKHISSTIIQQTLQRLNTVISYYNQATKKEAIPALILVYSKEAVSLEKIVKYQNLINDYSKSIPDLNRLKVEFIEDSQLDSLNVKRILEE